MANLDAAIKKIVNQYIPATTGATQAAWYARLADYATRKVAQLVPPPPVDDDDEAVADEPLSSDHATARAQLRARIGFPLGQEPEPDGAAMLAAATPEQARELALLGEFGSPGNPAFANADWSLFKEYWEPSSPPDEEDGLQSWAWKPEYAISGSGWKYYIEHKGA